MLVTFLKTIQQNGMNIETVYDIGAWRGRWSTEMKTHALPNANFVLFEANPAYETELKATGFPYSCGVALSNPGRKSVEFFNGTDSGDSYYKETTKYYDNHKSIELKCQTLDEVRTESNYPLPDFIKIDTQGSELDILSGGIETIKSASLIYTECPIVRYNEHAPNIQEYLDYFKSIGFTPVDILEIHKAEGILLQIDIMFVRADKKDLYIGRTENIRPFA